MTTTFVVTDTSDEANEGIELTAILIKCPNPECGALDFETFADLGVPFYPERGGRKLRNHRPAGVGAFRFLPTTAQPLSPHVPPAVQTDYEEACLISGLSPKSAATLARRALQGMIRDFWNTSKGTLAEELKAIEDKCDPHLYQAMMALKAVGNIGAHPERDVNLIIDIDPSEATQLLELVHLLDNEWYVARAARHARIQAVTALGAAKQEAKKAPKSGNVLSQPTTNGDGV